MKKSERGFATPDGRDWVLLFDISSRFEPMLIGVSVDEVDGIEWNLEEWIAKYPGAQDIAMEREEQDQREMAADEARERDDGPEYDKYEWLDRARDDRAHAGEEG